MSSSKIKKTVHYYKPGEDVPGGRPQFKYLMTAEHNLSAGEFKVAIVSIGLPNQPGAMGSEDRMIATNDVQEAFRIARATLDAHHPGLKPVMGDEHA